MCVNLTRNKFQVPGTSPTKEYSKKKKKNCMVVQILSHKCKTKIDVYGMQQLSKVYNNITH